MTQAAYGLAQAHDAPEKGPGLKTQARGQAAPAPARETGEAEAVAPPGGSDVDAALVRRARRGDAEAFEALVRRHLKVAYPVALSRVSDPHDAEDVCQDAFITALEKLDSCERPEHFRAWFLTIVRNRAHNFRQYQEVRRTQPLEHVAASTTRDDPARDAERLHMRERISEALVELTDLQRQVVVLHDYEGWKHKEIGERLGMSPGASRFHLHVARKRLRGLLADLQR